MDLATRDAVDMTDEMLEVTQRIGYANGEFRKGRIQDLANPG
jgi:hypothetical protein